MPFEVTLLLGIVIGLIVGAGAFAIVSRILRNVRVKNGKEKITDAEQEAKQILANEIPTLPSIPSWPNVSWFYEDGKYSLNESDVDKVLNYLENEMPLYEFEINRFEEEILIIINGLLEI